MSESQTMTAWMCLILGLAIGATTGIISASCKETSRWQREAVARGVAEYDSTTGKWKWTVERKVAGE